MQNFHQKESGCIIPDNLPNPAHAAQLIGSENPVGYGDNRIVRD
jgi:hypothetical protein